MTTLHTRVARRVAVSVLAALALSVCGCSNSAAPESYVPVAAPPAPTHPVPDVGWPTQAWLDRSLDLSSYDASQLAEIAESPLLVIQLRLLLSEEAQPALAQIRALNPDIVIAGVLDMLMIHEHFGAADQRARFPLGGALYDLLTPRIARTTTGEIPLMWPDAPMINPYRGGGFDQTLVDQLLDVVATAAQRYPDAVDGIFHDYLSRQPWPYPDGSASVDLDGDGVPASEDPDDQAAWFGYQRALIEGLQQRFGPGLVQIGNGRLPHQNSQIATRLAGIAYENFPTTVWGYSDLVGMDLMLAHHEPGWLTPRRGRTWSLLWDRSGTKLDFCRAASALSGQLYCKNDRDGFVGLDPWNGALGQPLTAMTQTSNPDGSWAYERSFEFGSAIIEFSSGGNSTRREVGGN